MGNNDKNLTQKKPDSGKSSFIRIAPGAKVDGLFVSRNTFTGNADVINNEGELKDARFDSNIQIIPSKITSKKSWWKKPEIIIPIILAIISIPWWSQLLKLLGF